MEREYQDLKDRVGDIFCKVGNIILTLPGVDKSKITMNLKIIQAVVMRFIRMIIYKKHSGILCTSPSEIIEYATTGFLKYIPKDDFKDREKIDKYLYELQMLLKLNK